MRSSLIKMSLLGLGLLISNGAMAATVEPVVIAKRNFKTYDVKPAEVSFSGTGYHEVIDDLGFNYAAAHWQDNSSPPNGTGTDAGDRRFPVSFTSGSKISLSAKLRISPTPVAGTDMRIRALGPGFDFPAQVATISNGQLLYPLAEASAALGAGVGFLNPMVLNWQVSTDGGNNWRAVGQTGNRVYSTFADPIASTLYETVLDIGARNANGATTVDTAVAAIWTDFAGPIPGVRRKVIDGLNSSDNVAMRYWLPEGDPLIDQYQLSNICHLLSNMLDPTRPAEINGVGTCHAWASLFPAVLKAQGIGGAQVITVRPPAGQFLLVKNWNFPATGTAPATCTPFPYRFTEIADQPGSPGQGNPNPPPVFNLHYIVQYASKLYDPSYGSGPYNSESAWENASLDGFLTSCTLPDNTTIGVAKKNNTGVVEATFTPE